MATHAPQNSRSGNGSAEMSAALISRVGKAADTSIGKSLRIVPPEHKLAWQATFSSWKLRGAAM